MDKDVRTVYDEKVIELGYEEVHQRIGVLRCAECNIQPDWGSSTKDGNTYGMSIILDCVCHDLGRQVIKSLGG